MDTSKAAKVALLFPGHGSQHGNMGRSLLGRDPVFTASFLRVLALSRYGRHAYDLLMSSDNEPAIHEVESAQPLIFAVDYALGQMVKSWGVTPIAYLGHSAGELVAAAHSGMISLQGAVALVDDRVAQALEAPRGGMLAVACSSLDVGKYIHGDVGLAADNAPRQVMLAGSFHDLARVRATLEKNGIAFADVPATSPFHSPLMAPAAEAHRSACARADFRAPAVPVISGYTTAPLTSTDWESSNFWSGQVVAPVLFQGALARLLEIGALTLIEAGASQTLTLFARRTSSVRSGLSTVWPMLPTDEWEGSGAETSEKVRAYLTGGYGEPTPSAAHSAPARAR